MRNDDELKLLQVTSELEVNKKVEISILKQKKLRNNKLKNNYFQYLMF